MPDHGAMSGPAQGGDNVHLSRIGRLGGTFCRHDEDNVQFNGHAVFCCTLSSRLHLEED